MRARRIQCRPRGGERRRSFVASADAARFLTHESIGAVIGDGGEPHLRLRPRDLAFGRNLTDPDLSEVARRSRWHTRPVGCRHDDLAAGFADLRGRAITNSYRSDAETLLRLRREGELQQIAFVGDRRGRGWGSWG